MAYTLPLLLSAVFLLMEPVITLFPEIILNPTEDTKSMSHQLAGEREPSRKSDVTSGIDVHLYLASRKGNGVSPNSQITHGFDTSIDCSTDHEDRPRKTQGLESPNLSRCPTPAQSSKRNSDFTRPTISDVLMEQLNTKHTEKKKHYVKPGSQSEAGAKHTSPLSYEYEIRFHPTHSQHQQFAENQPDLPLLTKPPVKHSLDIIFKRNSHSESIHADQTLHDDQGTTEDLFAISLTMGDKEKTDADEQQPLLSNLPSATQSSMDSEESSGSTESDLTPVVKRRHGACMMPVTFSEDEPLPWTCRSRRQWRSLPDGLYPNRLYETVCESSTCMNGHYNCTPVTYTTHVLELCFNFRCNDERTPYSMRRLWRFVDLDVTVGCTCSR